MADEELVKKRARTAEGTSAQAPPPPPPAVNPNPTQCSFFLAKKSRFCRFDRKPGSTLCFTHHAEAATQKAATGDEAAEDDANAASKRRVPCPLNPAHTVYAKDVEKHVKVCPDRRFIAADLPYFAANAHACRSAGSTATGVLGPNPWRAHDNHEGDAEAPDDENAGDDGEHHNNGRDADDAAAVGPSDDASRRPRRSHRQLRPEKLRELADLVAVLYDRHVVPVFRRLATTSAAVNEEEVKEPEVHATGKSATHKPSQKHVPQHRGILAEMKKVGVAPSSPQLGASAVVFVEMGAGKGGLALALRDDFAAAAAASSSSNSPRSTFVVVDRGGFRRKADGCVRNESNAFIRWRLDIKDLHLGKALLDARGDKDLCHSQKVVTCGKHLCGACTDFAISSSTTHLDFGGDGATAQVEAIVIATCCHHRCELQHLLPTTPESASPFFNFTADEFDCVASLTSWACCGTHAVSAEQRELGYMCKRLIDAARLQHLVESCGFPREKAYLAEYVPRSVSGENVLLIAYR